MRAPAMPCALEKVRSRSTRASSTFRGGIASSGAKSAYAASSTSRQGGGRRSGKDAYAGGGRRQAIKFVAVVALQYALQRPAEPHDVVVEGGVCAQGCHGGLSRF